MNRRQFIRGTITTAIAVACVKVLPNKPEPPRVVTFAPIAPAGTVAGDLLVKDPYRHAYEVWSVDGKIFRGLISHDDARRLGIV